MDENVARIQRLAGIIADLPEPYQAAILAGGDMNDPIYIEALGLIDVCERMQIRHPRVLVMPGAVYGELATVTVMPMPGGVNPP